MNRACDVQLHRRREPFVAVELVQDAFVKAYVHLPSFRRELPFEICFTRILTNTSRREFCATHGHGISDSPRNVGDVVTPVGNLTRPRVFTAQLRQKGIVGEIRASRVGPPT